MDQPLNKQIKKFYDLNNVLSNDSVAFNQLSGVRTKLLRKQNQLKTPEAKVAFNARNKDVLNLNPHNKSDLTLYKNHLTKELDKTAMEIFNDLGTKDLTGFMQMYHQNPTTVQKFVDDQIKNAERNPEFKEMLEEKGYDKNETNYIKILKLKDIAAEKLGIKPQPEHVEKPEPPKESLIPQQVPQGIKNRLAKNLRGIIIPGGPSFTPQKPQGKQDKGPSI